MEFSVQSLEDKLNKIPRVRSVAYPSNTVSHCVKLVETIYKIFGNSIFISREQIAQKTQISDSHLQTQLSSAVQYGLLEMKPKEGYKATSLFTKIYKPLPNEDVRLSHLEAFKQPELYKKVISEGNNQIYTVDGLSTVLFRKYKVSENASKNAAKVFLENAKALLLIDEEGLFNIEGVEDPAVEVVVEENDSFEVKPPEVEVKFLPPPQGGAGSPKKSFNHPPIPVFVDDDGNVAEVYLPMGFNREHISRVIKVLKAQIE